VPRQPKKDFSTGPAWDSTLGRWLAEIVLPDNSRRRRRFRRQRDAQVWWAAQLRSIEDGTWANSNAQNGLTLGDAITQYREHSKAHHRSFSTYVSNGLTVLEQALGASIPLKDVTTAHLEKMKLRRLEDDKVAKSTVDKNVSVAKSFFNWCINQGITDSNPVKKVKLFHEDNERVRFLDPDTEYPKLLAEVRKGPWYLEPMVMLDLNTGLRRRNLLDLRWDQVDFSRRIIRIESRTKNGHPLNLPLNETALRTLKAAHAKTGDQPHVFVHLEGRFEGGPVTDIKIAFNGAVRRAKIQNFRFHDLRHTFCSWLALRGVPLTAIQKLAGHASIKMTLRYAHLSPRYLADEVKTLDKYHSTDNPTDGTGIDVESTPKEVASPEAGEPLDMDSDGSSKPPRKARPQAVKADKPGLPMHGIGKK
jgi:integrase